MLKLLKIKDQDFILTKTLESQTGEYEADAFAMDLLGFKLIKKIWPIFKQDIIYVKKENKLIKSYDQEDDQTIDTEQIAMMSKLNTCIDNIKKGQQCEKETQEVLSSLFCQKNLFIINIGGINTHPPFDLRIKALRSMDKHNQGITTLGKDQVILLLEYLHQREI